MFPASLSGMVVKDLPASTRDVRGTGSILALGRPPSRKWLQDRCLESSVDRGAWRATVGLQRVGHD